MAVPTSPFRSGPFVFRLQVLYASGDLRISSFARSPSLGHYILCLLTPLSLLCRQRLREPFSSFDKDWLILVLPLRFPTVYAVPPFPTTLSSPGRPLPLAFFIRWSVPFHRSKEVYRRPVSFLCLDGVSGRRLIGLRFFSNPGVTVSLFCPSPIRSSR